SRDELAREVGGRPLLDRLGDLDHLGRALIAREHPPHEEEADGDGEQRREGGADQDEPLTPAEGEVLVAAFGGEKLHHSCISHLSQSDVSGFSIAPWVGAGGGAVPATATCSDRSSVRVTYTWRATRSPMVRV